MDPPCIASIRSLRRVSNDFSVRFGLVAEIIQRRHIANPCGGPDRMYGGASVILNSEGQIDYVISKRITNNARIAEQRSYAQGDGSSFWLSEGGALAPARCALRGLHGARSRGGT